MIDKIIDQAWASLLASLLKKQNALRPEMGEEINLFVPQSRLLSLAYSNPGICKLIYQAAKTSARRNANLIVRKLGMPPDYFWKFEFWPKARAFTNLGKIVNKVFSSMMSQAKEGNFEILDLDIDPLRISTNFSDCVECAGISGFQQGICYYHAGVFSGIISGLINRDLDGFETSCRASGGSSCALTLGDKTEEFIKTGMDRYLSPADMNTDLASRLEKTFLNLPVRALLGSQVNINYLKLVLACALLADPQSYATSHFTVGTELAHKLAPVLARFYKHEGLQAISDYYSQLDEFKLNVKKNDAALELIIKECAELAGDVKVIEMLSFTLGELQVLISEFSKTEMNIVESRFEGNKLLLTLMGSNEAGFLLDR
ncbi:MAG: V4R domain-containing protein [Chloroflexota bacterium]